MPKRSPRFAPGVWIRRLPGTPWETRAVILAIKEEVATIQQESKIETEQVTLDHLARVWKVLRPSYQTYRESALARSGSSSFPEWAAPGAKFSFLFEEVVYEIVEIRGMWVLSRDPLSGALLFLQGSQLPKYRPVQTRFQRVQ